MNPHKMSMSEQDQKAFKMYGKIPGKNLLTKMQKDRKYFDSGDYMMSKAGVPSAQGLGTAIPTPEGVPHASPPTPQPLSANSTGNIPTPVPGIFQQTSQNPIPGQNNNNANNNNQNGSNGGCGVGISPAATSEAVEVPLGGSQGHKRRGSESARISPPGTMREMPSSSYPIHHSGSFGSSPVKASSLANRLDEEMEN